MCGIFAYLSASTIDEDRLTKLREFAYKSRHRGPDASKAVNVLDNKGLLVFHRLCIVDTSDRGMQPFLHQGDLSICNGEIYNHEALRSQHGLQLSSGSDCEVIIPTINKVGVKETCQNLDGVFAFVVVRENGDVIVARDPMGVRCLYTGVNEQGDICFSSEMKSIPQDQGFHVTPFPPGTYSCYSVVDGKYRETESTRYYHYHFTDRVSDNEEVAVPKIRSLLETAVEKRLMSDRQIGCLLSGGLDSSVIAAVLCQKYQTPERRLKTFSVGLEGSVDLKYAKVVANHLGTDHTELILTEEEMIGLISDDIYHIETYHITTIRASTPMFALCQHIKKTTDIAVIFSGEGSDEASGSYMYFHNAPDPESFALETERLLSELHRYDVLRCDKSSAAAGLEIRVPFLDQAFLNYYMNLDPALKIPNGSIEKRMLRKAFQDLLPDEVTWRVKEGMSDGVSSMKRPWFAIIQDRVADKYAEADYLVYQNDPTPPKSNEALHFRTMFESYYHGRGHVIPHYWLPKWSGDLTEPSARVLSVYDTDKEDEKSQQLDIPSESVTSQSDTC